MEDKNKKVNEYSITFEQILIITRIFPPYRGGGSEYITWLFNFFKNYNCIFTWLITETHPNKEKVEKCTSGVILRKLKSASNYNGIKIIRYFRYVVQNMQYLFFFKYLFTQKKTLFWIHSSFFINPSLLPPILRIIRLIRKSTIRMVLDVRDPCIPKGRLSKLSFFDKLVSCSKRTTEHLAYAYLNVEKIVEIPIPLVQKQKYPRELPTRFLSYGIEEGKYLYAPNGIKETKGFPYIFYVWNYLCSLGYNYKLVISGSVEHWKQCYQNEFENNRMILLGKLRNEDVRILMHFSALVFSLGTSEGLPRSALEAIDANSRVMLPTNVPEFAHDMHLVLSEHENPYIAAKRIVYIIYHNVKPNYNSKLHDISLVQDKYTKLIKSFV